MFKRKVTLIFVLLLFSCLFLGVSFVSSNENISDDSLSQNVDLEVNVLADEEVLSDNGSDTVMPVDIPDCDMPQVTPTVSIIANDIYYVSGSGDVVEIVFKTNIANNDFWVEIPGWLKELI